MYTAVLVGLVGALIALLLGAIANFRVHQKPASCVICGLPLRFGYCIQAGSAKRDIVSVA
jgi:hypothetical protein